MADTQQGVRHQSARDAAGTVDTYNGDLRALFNAVATVPAGSTFNEAFMLWLQSVTGSSADNINDLAALYASQQEDTYNWSSVGTLGPPEAAFGTLIYLFDASSTSSFTLSGSDVITWTDLISGFAPTQGTGSARPVLTTDGSNPAVLFDGGDLLSITGLATSTGIHRTMFLVARATDRVANYYVYATRTTSDVQTDSIFETTSIEMTHHGTLASRMNLSNSDTLIHAAISRNDTSTAGTAELDDGTTDTDASVGVLRPDMDDLYIGASSVSGNNFVGYIMSIGAYEERIDDATKTELMDFLKTKWNL